MGSVLLYFIEAIPLTAAAGHLLIALLLILFLVMSLFFYIGGYLVLLYEIAMEYHRRKWSDPIDEEIVKVLGVVRRWESKVIEKPSLKKGKRLKRKTST